KLVSWLEGQGFNVSHVTPDGTSVYATAKASQVASSLGVHMVRVTRNGLAYTSAGDVPSLPNDVAADVTHIGGLQPFMQANKHFRMSGKHAADETNAQLSKKTANAPPYLASEILKAYGGDGLNLTGAGQQIAILIDTFPLDSDLTTFWN